MKKKVLALLMAACMVMGLTGCQSGDSGNGGGNGASESSGAAADAETAEDAGSVEGAGNNKEDITLTLAMCGDGTTKEALDDLLKMYTEKTGIKVESIFVASSWGEYCTKIQTMIGGGDELDCAIVAIEGISKFLDMGVAAPIDDWIAANQEIADGILADTSPAFQEVEGIVRSMVENGT